MTSVGHGDGRRKQSKTGEDGSYPQLMLAMIKGVVDVGVVLSSNPFLCLSFKLDVLTT